VWDLSAYLGLFVAAFAAATLLLAANYHFF
jgi:hypothetical protein